MDTKEIEKNYNRKYTLKRKESKDLYNKEYHAKNYNPKEKPPQTCRHHPDRERVYRSRLCRDCYNKQMRKYQYNKKPDLTILSSWAEINLKDFLHDAKLGWDVTNLARRYNRSRDCVHNILKEHGITPKLPLGSVGKINLKNLIH